MSDFSKYPNGPHQKKIPTSGRVRLCPLPPSRNTSLFCCHIPFYSFLSSVFQGALWLYWAIRLTQGNIPTSRSLITFSKSFLPYNIIYPQVLEIVVWTSLGRYSVYYNNYERLDNYLKTVKGKTGIWKIEEGFGLFRVVPRDRIRTSGWKLLRRQICTHFKRELSYSQSIEDRVGSLVKKQHVPDTGTAKQRMKDLLVELLWIGSGHWLGLGES